MHHRLFLLFLFFISSSVSYAQMITLNVNGGYLFGDRFNVSGGKAKIEGQWATMGIIAADIGQDRTAEIAYLWQETIGKLDFYNAQTSLNEAINMHYILVGASQHFETSENLSFSLGSRIGLMVLAPRKPMLEDIVKFAVGFQAGSRLMVNSGMGVQFSANLFFPVTDIGGYLWWSPGSGSQIGLSSRIPFAQFGMFGGIIIIPSQIGY
ncbi:MAG: hypothetical protein IPM52_09980 [Bacteroidetes bacterium]|nr:hypothetical protein [Bacteroidota bacterium]